jgi:hypothetical protein
VISLLAWFLTGHLLLRLLVRRPPSLGAALALGMALGVLLRLMAVVLQLGFFAHVSIQLLVTIGLAVAVAFSPRRPCVENPRLAPPRSTLGGLALSAGMVLTAAAGLLILVRFVGVPAANFDVLSYHVPLATALLDPAGAQALFWEPSTFYARLPLGGPMLEEPFLVSSSGGMHGIALQVFLVVCVLATAASAARIVAWFGGRVHARLAAVALVILHPMGSGAVLNSLQEPIMGLFAMAGFELMLHGVARRTEGRVLLLLGGLVACSAVAVKLSAVGVVAIPQAVALALVLGGAWRRRPGRCVAACAAWGVGALLAVSPWFLRGIVVAGHPLHPFGGFSDSWTAEQARFVVEVHSPQSILSGAYWGDARSKLSQFGFEFGGVSLMLLGAMLAFASARGRRAVPLVAAAVLAYLAYLGVRSNPARFLFPGVLLLVPAAVIAVSALRVDRRWRHAPLIGLAAGCLAAVMPQMRSAQDIEPFYLPSSRREILGAYVGADLVPYAQMAGDLAGEGTLLLIFESRPSLFRGVVESRTVWDQASYADDLKAATSDEDFARRLLARGVTAIFVNEPEWGRYLDFYAAEQMGPGERRFGRMTIAGPINEAERQAGLLHYPPHRAAGLGTREMEIFEAFLRTLRRSTIISSPAGRAEIWAARIPSVDRTEPSR